MSLSKRVCKERLETLRNGKFMIASTSNGRLMSSTIKITNFEGLLKECFAYEYLGKVHMSLNKSCFLIENNVVYNVNRWIRPLYTRGILKAVKSEIRNHMQCYKIIEA